MQPTADFGQFRDDVKGQIQPLMTSVERILAMRESVQARQDAMAASESRMVSLVSPLIDLAHETCERLTELDLK